MYIILKHSDVNIWLSEFHWVYQDDTLNSAYFPIEI